jgi:hypothetical protein
MPAVISIPIQTNASFLCQRYWAATIRKKGERQDGALKPPRCKPRGISTVRNVADIKSGAPALKSGVPREGKCLFQDRFPRARLDRRDLREAFRLLANPAARQALPSGRTGGVCARCCGSRRYRRRLRGGVLKKFPNDTRKIFKVWTKMCYLTLINNTLVIFIKTNEIQIHARKKSEWGLTLCRGYGS